MTDSLIVLATAVAGYVLGSVSAAHLVAANRGLNIRTVGTRNPGTMNVWRQVGPRWGAAVFLGDLLKGLVPVVAARALGVAPEWAVLAGAGAVVGHWYPLFLRFRGGAGLATGMGTALGIAFLPGLLALAVGLAFRLRYRNSSAAAAVGYVLFLAGGLLVFREPWLPLTAATLVGAAVGLRTWFLEGRHQHRLGRGPLP